MTKNRLKLEWEIKDGKYWKYGGEKYFSPEKEQDAFNLFDELSKKGYRVKLQLFEYSSEGTRARELIKKNW